MNSELQNDIEDLEQQELNLQRSLSLTQNALKNIQANIRDKKNYLESLKPKMGDVYTHSDAEELGEHILARIDVKDGIEEFALISMVSGERWTNPKKDINEVFGNYRPEKWKKFRSYK